MVKNDKNLISKQYLLENPKTFGLHVGKMKEFHSNDINDCKRCGQKFNFGNKYCGNCGMKRVL